MRIIRLLAAVAVALGSFLVADVSPATAAGSIWQVQELASNIGAEPNVLLSRNGVWAMVTYSAADGGGELIDVATRAVTALPTGYNWADVDDSGDAIGNTTGTPEEGVVFADGKATTIAPASFPTLNAAGGNTVAFTGQDLNFTAMDDSGTVVGDETGSCDYNPSDMPNCQLAVEWTQSGGIVLDGTADYEDCSGTDEVHVGAVYSINSDGLQFGEQAGGCHEPCTASGYEEWVSPSSVTEPWGCSLTSFSLTDGNRDFNDDGDELAGDGYYSGLSNPTITTIPIPSSYGNNAQLDGAAITDSDQVVGTIYYTTPQYAFYWSAATGTETLTDATVSDAFAAGWSGLAAATDISNNGLIVGYGGGPDAHEDAFLIDTTGGSNPSPTNTTLSLHGSGSTITDGGTVTLTGTLLDASSKPISSEDVVLEYKKAGASSFTSGPEAESSSTGKVSFSVEPAAAVTYELAFLGDSFYNDSTSSALTVSVKWKVALKSSASKVKSGKPVKLSVAVAPSDAGKTVELQRKSGKSWKNVAKVKLGSKSTGSVTEKPKSTTSYRISVAAGKSNAANTSSAVTVKA